MDRLEKLKSQINETQNDITEIGFEDEGRIGVIYLNSPKNLNAMTVKMKKEIAYKLHLLETNPVVKVIVILSKLEKLFCAGADIKEFEGITHESQMYNDIFFEFRNVLNTLKKPIIAGVHGMAFGGGFEIALACDMIVLRDQTKIGLPEINLGLIPGWGGTQRLPRLIGKGNAARFILSGEPMTAQRAYELGIAQEVFPKDENFHQNVIKFAKKFSNKGMTTLLVAKQSYLASQENTLAQGNVIEANFFNSIVNTKEKKVGVEAFINKKKPNFNF